MLKFPQKKFKWSGKAQSGFYFDFILKKFADVFIRNVFINAALFFGEKYMIEHITKKIVDNFIFNSNKFFGWTKLNFSVFFFFIYFNNFILIIIIKFINTIFLNNCKYNIIYILYCFF